MSKATFRIPDPLLEELRKRSRQEGRSINAVVVDSLRSGLGKRPVNPKLEEILGPLIAKPATRTYTIGDAERALAELPVHARDLREAFEWTREET